MYKLRVIIIPAFLFIILSVLITSNESKAYANQIVENEYLQYSVSDNGRFTIGTSGGDLNNSLDDYKKLLYGHPNPSTSYTTINIDGIPFHFNSTQPVIDYATLTTIASQTINNMKITQEISIVKNENTNKEDTVRIRYLVTNNDSSSHQIGLRIMLDTMLANNDAAPFRVPGLGAVTTETEVSGQAIPQYWQAFDSLSHPTVISHGTLINSGMTNKPDKVQFTNWNNVYQNIWDYSVTNQSNGDSAVSIIWDSKEIRAGETKDFITYYGISDFQQDLRPPLALIVTGPTSVHAGENGYNPNPITITAYISNIGNSKAKDVNLSLDLPEGLTLLSGQEQSGLIGDLEVGNEKQVSWLVSIEESNLYRNLDYSINLTASNTENKTLSRTILIPPILPVNNVEITPKNLILMPGDSQQLSVKAKMRDGSILDVTSSDKGTTYSSSNVDWVTVSAEGEIAVNDNAPSGSTVYIRAYYNGKMDITSIKINEKSLVAIKTDPIPLEINQGGSHQITGVKAIWSDGTETEVTEEIKYQSSNTNRFIVSETGLIEAVPGAIGRANISIGYGGKIIEQLITLKAPPTLMSIELIDPIPTEIDQDEPHQISGLKAKWSDGTETVVMAGITYQSSNTNRLKVTETGLIEAVPGAIGRANISVSYGGKIIEQLITLKSPPTLMGIELLNPIPAEIGQGDPHQIAGLKAKWSNGSETEVTTGITYQSSNTNRFTVTETGLIEAVPGAIGRATITISYNGKIIERSVSLKAPPTLMSIELLNPIPAEMGQDNPHQITGLKAKWSNGSETEVTTGITYQSSNTNRFTVSETGLIKAVPGAIGRANITISYNGKIIERSVSLKAPPTLMSIELLNPIPAEIDSDMPHQITGLKAKWSNGAETEVTTGITYQSSNMNRLTVTETGLIEAVPGAIGRATITINYNGKIIERSVSLKAPPTLMSIELLNPIPAEIDSDMPHQITGLKAKWSNGAETEVTTGITYQSSNTSRITVSESGLIEAMPRAIGRATITISYNGKVIEQSVSLKSPPTLMSIELIDPLPAEIAQNGSHQISGLVAKWSDGSETEVATGITYQSSNTNRFTVSETGLIEAVPGAIGRATITISYNGKIIEQSVSLKSPPTLMSIELIDPLPAEIAQNGSHQISGLVAKWSDGSETEVTTGITYQSSNTSRFTVSETGLIEAVPGAIGRANITVKYGSKIIEKLITLKVP